jgi:hypothetical protein
MVIWKSAFRRESRGSSAYERSASPWISSSRKAWATSSAPAIGCAATHAATSSTDHLAAILLSRSPCRLCGLTTPSEKAGTGARKQLCARGRRCAWCVCPQSKEHALDDGRPATRVAALLPCLYTLSPFDAPVVRLLSLKADLSVWNLGDLPQPHLYISARSAHYRPVCAHERARGSKSAMQLPLESSGQG